ncbi:MAG: AAA family ATPase [Coriobacteriaceae bacterium]|nr:AAA family ATPase [Coriobacteriaceae bacterium]
MNDLFIRSLSIDWDEIPESSYVRGITAVARLDGLVFDGPVTVFAGDNGTGKSTLLEAIAVAAGFNAEGGTRNYRFSTYDDVSELCRAVHLVRGFRRIKVGSFLRAESFFNVASTAMREYNDDGAMEDWHAESHGESFLSFLTKYRQPGLFLMDEPEAALSPQRQLVLARHVVEKAGEGSQFIIATHSPILLAIPGARILSFDGGVIHECVYDEAGAVRFMRAFLDDPRGVFEEGMA